MKKKKRGKIPQSIQCRVKYFQEHAVHKEWLAGLARYRVTTDPVGALIDGVSPKEFDALAQKVFHIDGEDCFVRSTFYWTGNWVALFVHTGVDRSYKFEFANRLGELLEKKLKKRKKKKKKSKK